MENLKKETKFKDQIIICMNFHLKCSFQEWNSYIAKAN